MDSIGYRLAALAVIFAWLGCSSKASKAVGDGSVGNSEAGVAIDGKTDGKTMDGKGIDSARSDTNTLGVDVGRGLDTRDASGVDLTALDSASDARDARDLANVVDVARDSKDSAGASGDAIDAPQGGDANVTTVDVGIDSSPVGLGTCVSPIVVQLGVARVDIKVSTGEADHLLDSPCAGNGGDVIVKFRVPTQQPQLVYADTFGAAWNTALFFSDTCDKPKSPTGTDMVVCNDDACGTGQSQVVAALGLGYHYLIVSGANGESGEATVHIQSAVLGNGSISVLPQGTGSLNGATSGIDRSGLCETSGPKNNYWWLSCPDDVGGAFSASTCQGATWDTALSLQVPRDDALACNDDDDNCGMQSTIATTVSAGAGIQVLTVGGVTGKSLGSYSLVYTRP